MIRITGQASSEKGGKSLWAPLAGLLAGLLLLVFSGGLFLYAQLYGPGLKTATRVTLAHGLSVRGMGQELEKAHVIHSASLFRMAARFNGRHSLKAGTYEFPAGTSLMSALRRIEDGKVVQTFVTIPEGRTSAQAVRILMGIKDLTGDVEVPPEGAILPETYLYQPGETRQAVLDRMLDAGRDTLDALWAKRAPNLPFATKEDALIMASIVERETARFLEGDKSWYQERLSMVEGRIRRRLGELSRRLGDADWLDGEFSAGDLLMVSVLLRLGSSGILDEFPNLSAFVARGEARPAYRRALEAQLAVFTAASGR